MKRSKKLVDRFINYMNEKGYDDDEIELIIKRIEDRKPLAPHIAQDVLDYTYMLTGVKFIFGGDNYDVS